MTHDDRTIRILRGPGGEVEVTGPVDATAKDILLRAAFIVLPALNGPWIRLPFGLGHHWENEHATWAAEILTAARYPVHLDPSLRHGPSAPAPPARPPKMSTQRPPPRRTPR
ncbi:hypothetical protein ACFUCQ_02900 [Streptomyces sp. NPDC057197]|uniref:hypothetical protein n=1 Tax=Streptomyces sp. NPDC057197 TaxID=3346045 RepID=UPI003642AEC2